eukprot:m.445005 g.445005  ORF g.445005 m.445005 type:complete len:994 (+) comp56842_c0_seq1:1277-4258(+)
MGDRYGRLGARMRRQASHDLFLGLPPDPLAALVGGGVAVEGTNSGLVQQLFDAGALSGTHTVAAFNAVDRRHFLPHLSPQRVYCDTPASVEADGYTIHLSAPSIYALALQALDLRPGQSFLNIGSGSGYLSVVAGILLHSNTEQSSINHGVEICQELVEYSRERVNMFMSSSESALVKPVLVQGSCFDLDPAVQYDRIYCGAECPAEPAELLQRLLRLLKPGGSIVLPFGSALTCRHFLRVAPSGEVITVASHLCPAAFKSLIVNEDNQEEAFFTIQGTEKVLKQAVSTVVIPAPAYLPVHSLHKTTTILRALQVAIECLLQAKPFPLCFGFTQLSCEDIVTARDEVFYASSKVGMAGHRIRSGPSTSAATLGTIPKGAEVHAFARLHTDEGTWVRVAAPEQISNWTPVDSVSLPVSEAWSLAEKGTTTYLKPKTTSRTPDWLKIVEACFVYGSASQDQQRVLIEPNNPNMATITKLCAVPPSWSYDCDAQLLMFAHFWKLPTSVLPEHFVKERLMLFPLLDGRDFGELWPRLLILRRITLLLDEILTRAPSVLAATQHPSSDSPDSTFEFLAPVSVSVTKPPFAFLRHIRALLPASARRWRVISQLLEQLDGSSHHTPRIKIDRNKARSQPPKYENSLTYQIHDALSSKDTELSYAWGKNVTRWWEVQFIGEGIIDQGGGFRESLTELAEELCPPQSAALIVPLFIPTPNHRDNVGEYREAYVPNPGCCFFTHYRWLGKLIAAAIRTGQSLPLSLPPIFWKQLLDEKVTFERDFRHVDEAGVQSMDRLANVDEEQFDIDHARDLRWTAILSDNSIFALHRDGHRQPVQFSRRDNYVQAVKQARLTENAKQVAAIRGGLISVIPESVLQLFTWQELEKHVCGSPNVTLEAMREFCRHDGIPSDDPSLALMWSALENFSPSDLSQFLRFVTGRKRLPVHFTIAKGSSVDNSLPVSTTCTNTLYLPSYTNVQTMEAKLRYAIYNCVAIDADTSPW